MVLTKVKPGDTIKVNKRGRIFQAEVVEKDRGKLKIKPLDSNISYHEATAREVLQVV
jgi:hypothetical protein